MGKKFAMNANALASEVTAQADATHPSISTAQRLMSLDALRGFDMFWIIGGGEVLEGLKGGR